MTYSIGFLIFLVGTRFVRIETRLTDWLGRISYSIYLFHVIVFLAIEWWLLRQPRGIAVAHAACRRLCGDGVAAMLAVASLVYRFVERPGIRLGHRLAERWQQRAARRSGRDRGRTRGQRSGPREYHRRVLVADHGAVLCKSRTCAAPADRGMRLRYIDALRGIAALLVLWLHVANSLSALSPETAAQGRWLNDFVIAASTSGASASSCFS